MADSLPAPTSLKGPWSLPEVEAFLRAADVPMRLATNGANGFPVLTPLWFAWMEGALWAAVQPSTAIARALARDPKCAFEISRETPPYQGVRGRGHAEATPEGLSVLRRLLSRYLGEGAPAFQKKLMAASQGEIALRIQPLSLTSWDFSARMRS